MVVACTILQKSLDVIILTRDFVFLNESDIVLEEAQLHAKQLIELADFLSFRREFACRLCPFGLLGGQRCRYGTVVGESC